MIYNYGQTENFSNCATTSQKTARQLRTQGSSKNWVMICLLFIHHLPFALPVPAPLATDLACNISIFDLRWAHVSTCSYPLPPICLAAALYSYWSVHLLVSVPEMNTRLNALSSSCCVDSGERQRGLRWIKLKWNRYLKWMWCQSRLGPFLHCGSYVLQWESYVTVVSYSHTCSSRWHGYTDIYYSCLLIKANS